MMESTTIRMKVAPDTLAYADDEGTRLTVEFALPGAPADTIELKMLEDSVHLSAPAGRIEYITALSFWSPVSPERAEASYENGLLRVWVPFKDPMEDAVRVPIKGAAATPAIEPGQQKGRLPERKRAA